MSRFLSPRWKRSKGPHDLSGPRSGQNDGSSRSVWVQWVHMRYTNSYLYARSGPTVARTGMCGMVPKSPADTIRDTMDTQLTRKQVRARRSRPRLSRTRQHGLHTPDPAPSRKSRRGQLRAQRSRPGPRPHADPSTLTRSDHDTACTRDNSGRLRPRQVQGRCTRASLHQYYATVTQR